MRIAPVPFLERAFLLCLLCLLCLLASALVLPACGGSAGGGAGSLPFGNYPVPGDPGAPPSDPPGDPGTGEPPFPGLTGGVLATIDTGGEIWSWWVTNPVTATYLEQAWKGAYSGTFHGTLRAGPGAGGHNAPWSWHVDPEANGHALAFFAPPAPMPTKPSECERNLPIWLSRDTLFVPGSFTIVAFDDRRP